MSVKNSEQSDADKDPAMLHVETARLVSVLAIAFGALLALLGMMMIIGLNFSADAYGSAGLVWGGAAFVLAGTGIRRTRTLLQRPRWFFAACLFGISSSAGLYKTVLTSDAVGAVGMITMQAIALYALWRACRQ